MKLSEHPTVRGYHEKAASQPVAPSTLDAAWLRQLCLDCGADDVGLVEISRPASTNSGKTCCVTFHLPGVAQFRLPDEPGADPQHGPVGRQPRVSPCRR